MMSNSPPGRSPSWARAGEKPAPAAVIVTTAASADANRRAELVMRVKVWASAIGLPQKGFNARLKWREDHTNPCVEIVARPTAEPAARRPHTPTPACVEGITPP